MRGGREGAERGEGGREEGAFEGREAGRSKDVAFRAWQGRDETCLGR